MRAYCNQPLYSSRWSNFVENGTGTVNHRFFFSLHSVAGLLVTVASLVTLAIV